MKAIGCKILPFTFIRDESVRQQQCDPLNFKLRA